MSNASPAAVALTPAPQATPDSERIRSLDLLRGFAILGILYMNIQAFSMPFSAYANPTTYGDLHGANLAVWLAGRILVDQKFMSMFSALFGAGIVLMTGRVEARGIRPLRLHYRRMGWLLLIGLAHGFLLWSGDILVAYAICGSIIYRARKWTPRRLLTAAFLLFLFGGAIGFFATRYFDRFPADFQEFARESWQPPRYVTAETLADYRGGWLAQNRQRDVETFFIDTTGFMFYGWRVVGLMLAGMALYKLDILTARRSTKFYAWMMAVGFGLGIPLASYGAWRVMQSGFSFGYGNFVGAQFNYWDSLTVCVGWIGLMMLVSKRWGDSPRLRPLAAAGQMAFTNYLLQTVLCTTLFYGHGFGLYGRVSRVEQLGIVIAVWIVELTLSPIWLRHFRFGPFEWLWRSLTYGHRQPMRRAPRLALAENPAD